MKMPALMALLLGATGLLAANPGSVVRAIATPSTVFVVRHAEKAREAEDPRDPPLSEAGQRRAQALARLLFRAGVTRVYTSQFTRTQQTVQPLANSLGLTPTVVDASDTAEQARLLQALPAGAVALVAGHSNTVPRLVEALGGAVKGLVEVPPYGEILEDSEYDRLFAVTYGEGVQTQVIELRYGAPKP